MGNINLFPFPHFKQIRVRAGSLKTSVFLHINCKLIALAQTSFQLTHKARIALCLERKIYFLFSNIYRNDNHAEPARIEHRKRLTE